MGMYIYPTNERIYANKLARMYTHVDVCEKKHMLTCAKKKAKKNPAAWETPDPCILSGPEIISYTFRHTPSDTQHLGLPGGAVGAMDMQDK